jgi:hypothetical protein
MKTAFKLLLLSASFLSADAIAKCQWVKSEGYPGDNPGSTISPVATSADGQILYTTETYPDIKSTRITNFLWKSFDGGVSWWTLKIVK